MTASNLSLSQFGFGAVEPLFPDEHSGYGGGSVFAKNMDDLATGQFRLRQSTEHWKRLKMPVSLSWFVKAFKDDVNTMRTVISECVAKTIVLQAVPSGKDAAADDTKKVIAANTKLLTENAALWGEALSVMAFDVILVFIAGFASTTDENAIVWDNCVIQASGKDSVDDGATRAAIRKLCVQQKWAPVTASAYARAVGDSASNLFGNDGEDKESQAFGAGSGSSSSGSGSSSSAYGASSSGVAPMETKEDRLPASLFADGKVGQKRARTVSCSKCQLDWADSNTFCGKCGLPLVKPIQPAIKKLILAGRKAVSSFGFVSAAVPAPASGDEEEASSASAPSAESTVKDRNRILRLASLAGEGAADLELWCSEEVLRRRKPSAATFRVKIRGQAGFEYTTKPSPKRNLSFAEWISAWLAYSIDVRAFVTKARGEKEALSTLDALVGYQRRITAMYNNAENPDWPFLRQLDLAWRQGIATGVGTWLEPSTVIYSDLQNEVTRRLIEEAKGTNGKRSSKSDTIDLSRSDEEESESDSEPAVKRKNGAGKAKKTELKEGKCRFGWKCYRDECSFTHPKGFVPGSVEKPKEKKSEGKSAGGGAGAAAGGRKKRRE
ncbi:MAG: zinc finger CCCH domain-containing protein [Chthoniobacterales bacterium]|nr:zinc finger CCCH domain-containing protein [Chthoniobacterales bacterium]